jgi:transcriptional regulator with XRE-family HTH domain
MLTHEQLKNKMLQDPEVKKLYEQPDPEFELLDVLLKARKRAKMTQEDVAKKMHVSRPVISRIESASTRHSPRISTLRRYAKALGCKLEIKLKRV